MVLLHLMSNLPVFSSYLILEKNMKIIWHYILKGSDGYSSKWEYRAGIVLFKVNNGNNRTMCEICSKLTLKTPERRYQRCSGVFIVNFEQISFIILVFPLLNK